MLGILGVVKMVVKMIPTTATKTTRVWMIRSLACLLLAKSVPLLVSSRESPPREGVRGKLAELGRALYPSLSATPGERKDALVAAYLGATYLLFWVWIWLRSSLSSAILRTGNLGLVREKRMLGWLWRVGVPLGVVGVGVVEELGLLAAARGAVVEILSPPLIERNGNEDEDEEEGEGEEECAICYGTGGTGGVYSYCGYRQHTFHGSCLQAWFEMGGAMRKTCPLCREDLNTQVYQLDRWSTLMEIPGYVRGAGYRLAFNVGGLVLAGVGISAVEGWRGWRMSAFCSGLVWGAWEGWEG